MPSTASPASARYTAGDLFVSGVFNASREAVFDAWIDPRKVERWWGCPDTTAVSAEIEPRLGGLYRQRMTLTDGTVQFMGGHITAYDPPARLAFSLEGMPGSDGTDMQVTVDFIELDGQTEVRLTQERLPEGLSLSVHTGWLNSFRNLLDVLSDSDSA